MNRLKIQNLIDLFIEASPQQWLFRTLAVATPLGAMLATSAANQQLWLVGLAIVTGLAAVSALVPDSDVALIVVIVVVWRWLAAVDSIDTPWLPVAAVCLLGYHSVTALAASIPNGGELERDTTIKWLVQTALIGAMTVGTWGLVVMFDRRDADGNIVLSLLALALVSGAALTIRSRSLT